MTNLLFTNFRPLALTSYLKKRRGKSSYRGFLAIHRDDIIALPSSFSTWKNVDDFWALNFLKEAEKLDKSAFDDLKERVRFFLFCKGRVTPRRIRSDSGELLSLTHLVSTQALNSGALNLLLVKVCWFWRRNWLCTFFYY